MTLPQNDLSGFATDDEVPMVELSDDEVILRDSNGVATAVVDRANFEAPKPKKRTKKSKHQSATNPYSQQPPVDGSPLPPPPGLAYYQNSPKISQPTTPKEIPPFFQFVGAVAGKAKEFFNGPPLPSPNVTPSQPNPSPVMYQPGSTRMYQGMPLQNPGMPPQKVPFSAFNEYPSFQQQPPPQYNAFGQQPPPEYLQAPEPPMMGFMNQPSMDEYYEKPRHKKKSKKHSKHKLKKSKYSDYSDNETGNGDLLNSTSPLLPVLILLAAGLVYMLAQNRPPVTGPISAGVDRALANLQIGAIIGMILSAAIIVYKYIGPAALQQPVASPAPSIPVAGSFGTPAAGHVSIHHPMSFFPPGMQQQPSMGPPMGQLGTHWQGFQQGMPGMPGAPGGVPPMNQGFPMGYQNAMPQGMPGMNAPRRMSAMPGMHAPKPIHGLHSQYSPYGAQFEEDDTDDELDYMPAGSFEARHQQPNVPRALRPLRRSPASPPARNLYNIDGLSKEMLEEESKPSYFDHMPVLPGIDDEEIEPALYSSLRQGPDPELLRNTDTKRAKQPKAEKKKKATNEPTEEKKKTKNSEKSNERIKGTNKKKENVYVDEYACKPYGPPPKRYRGVNV